MVVIITLTSFTVRIVGDIIFRRNRRCLLRDRLALLLLIACTRMHENLWRNSSGSPSGWLLKRRLLYCFIMQFLLLLNQFLVLRHILVVTMQVPQEAEFLRMKEHT
jgi:hypothetical protein